MKIRRRTGLAAGLGLAASVMAVAYLDRASGSGSALDWLICVAMALVAVLQLTALVDGRTPLLVADEQGVRVRLGREWLGLPWATLEQVVVEERDGPLRDGRVLLAPRDPDSALEAVDAVSRRHARWHRRWYGAPLTVPLSLGTRTDCEGAKGFGDIAGELRRLADGRTDVAVMRGRERARLDPVAQPGPASGAARHGRAEIGRLVSRLGGRDHDVDAEADSAPEADPAPEAGPAPEAVAEPVPSGLPRPDPVAAVRAARTVMRAEVVRDERPRIGTPEQDLEPLPAPEDDDSTLVVPGSLAFDDLAPTAGSPDPVIGPQLAQARRRAGLDVDRLSERTTIRPHVIEAMEVDDFGPCGGDFYARGHLRTLARYLGLDAEELLGLYDARYAHGPINARRVFEAELATGISGGMRATMSGPRWSLLAAAVLSLLMIWGVARFFTEEPARVASPTPAVSDSAGLAANHHPITSPLTRTSHLTVAARGHRTHVVVRDRTGKELWSGVVHRGHHRVIVGLAPFQVHASNGAATRLQVGHRELGTTGDTAHPATRTVG